MKFKSGQRVVFKHNDMIRHQDVIYPKDGEIVTIDDPCASVFWGLNYVTLKEYPRPIYGDINGICELCFKKMDYSFADSILNKLIEQ